jgi:hypothetical protein
MQGEEVIAPLFAATFSLSVVLSEDLNFEVVADYLSLETNYDRAEVGGQRRSPLPSESSFRSMGWW